MYQLKDISEIWKWNFKQHISPSITYNGLEIGVKVLAEDFLKAKEKTMIKEEGTVQRNDLNLRIKYIGLETEIYQLDTYKYVIYCYNFGGSFADLAKDFDHTIRQIGTNVGLTDQRPVDYIARIEAIPLSNVVYNFRATCITKPNLDNFITSKFHDVDITSITIPKKGIDFEILIEVSKMTDKKQIQEMKEFLLDVDLGTDKITVRYEKEAENLPPNLNKKDIVKLDKSFEVMQLSLHKEIPTTIVEADYWFEYAEDIYTGRLQRDDLPFFREESLKCFLDFSLFDNINLRNVLLLYDTVYIALPIEDLLTKFLEDQKISIVELVELVEMGKVVLMLPNLETRYDKELILEAYNCNPNGIIGRRGINMLIASYLAETRWQYEERLPNIYKIASKILMEGLRDENSYAQNIARLLAWPITASLNSFYYLNKHSPMSVSNFGINEVVRNHIISDEIQSRLDFEFTANSLSSHIAAALNATYFPFRQYDKQGNRYSDAGISNILRNFLKLYWYDADNLEKIKNLHQQGSGSLLKLFDCKHNIDIVRVANIADEYKTHIAFRNILSKLDKMDEAQRNAKIREYNNLLYDVSKVGRGKDYDITEFILGKSSFLPLNYPTSLILSSIGLIRELHDNSKFAKKNIENKIIEKCFKNSNLVPNKQEVEDIYLLDKISSVATLK